MINWGNSPVFQCSLGPACNNVKDYSKDAEISHIEHMQLYLFSLFYLLRLRRSYAEAYSGGDKGRVVTPPPRQENLKKRKKKNVVGGTSKISFPNGIFAIFILDRGLMDYRTKLDRLHCSLNIVLNLNTYISYWFINYHTGWPISNRK